LIFLEPRLDNGCKRRFPSRLYDDDHALTVTTETAKEAFAKAVEWHVVQKLTDVTISDGSKTYSIAEFSSAIANASAAGL
jgi:hypothetical protein